jgi:hypothetical protein
MFAKFDDAELEDPSAVYADDSAKLKASTVPPRAESLGITPVHKSALPTPPPLIKPPRNPSKPAETTPPRKTARTYEPPPYKGRGRGDMPSAVPSSLLIGPNLTATAAQQVSLTDQSPFAQSLERMSSALSRSSAQSNLSDSGLSKVHSYSATRSKQPSSGTGTGSESHLGLDSISDEGLQRELAPSQGSGSSSKSNAALVKRD